MLNLIFEDSALLQILSQQKRLYLYSGKWNIKLNINISQKSVIKILKNTYGKAYL